MRRELEERYQQINEVTFRYNELELMYRDLHETYLAVGKKGPGALSQDYIPNEEDSYGRAEDWEVELMRKKLMEQEQTIVGLRV